MLPSPLRDWVGRFDPFDFGARYPFTCVPAYRLPVYASQWPLPGTTQDSVPGCWLGFTRAAISGRCVSAACKAQPPQIRTCLSQASGSSETEVRYVGNELCTILTWGSG